MEFNNTSSFYQRKNKVKILSVGNAEFIDTLNLNKPITPIKVQVLENISGDILPDETTVYMFGGKVSVLEAIKNLPQESIKKMGLDNIDKKNIDSSYISYTSDSDYNVEVGNEYIIILDKQSNDIYTIAANGYGVFKQNNKLKSGNNYNNVLTDEAYEFKS